MAQLRSLASCGSEPRTDSVWAQASVQIQATIADQSVSWLWMYMFPSLSCPVRDGHCAMGQNPAEFAGK